MARWRPAPCHHRYTTLCRSASSLPTPVPSLPNPSPFLLQLLTLDPSANQRHSDRTSGFTSPSHFSSPSLGGQLQLSPRVETPVSPDSMVEGSPHPGDADFASDASSISATAHCHHKTIGVWVSGHKAGRAGPAHHRLQGYGAADHPASEEDGSHTHTSTLKPRPASVAGPQDAVASCQLEGAPHSEDPIVLSLWVSHITAMELPRPCNSIAARKK